MGGVGGGKGIVQKKEKEFMDTDNSVMIWGEEALGVAERGYGEIIVMKK